MIIQIELFLEKNDKRSPDMIPSSDWLVVIDEASGLNMHKYNQSYDE